MAARPDTQASVILALELMRRIPRRGYITAAELHVQLVAAGIQRGLRTIQRQLDMISEHFDIERDDRSKPYGYRWKEHAKGLALPMLSAQESLLLTLAEQHLRSLLPANLMKSMSGFFVQARANLGPHTSRRPEREWLTKVRVVSSTQPLLPPRINPGVLEEVSNGLFANLWLKLDYINAAGAQSDIEVMPLGLAQQGPRMYLVCRYKGFDNERSLAMNRIVSARALISTFSRPKDFDLEKYEDDGRFGFGDGKRVELSFEIDRTAGAHLLESPLSTDQCVVEMGNRLTITATVAETERLKWWLRGFGDQVRQVRYKRVLDKEKR